jgi:hypothetical protein
MFSQKSSKALREKGTSRAFDPGVYGKHWQGVQGSRPGSIYVLLQTPKERYGGDQQTGRTGQRTAYKGL